MPSEDNGIVLAFPGQGSYHPWVLRELFRGESGNRAAFEIADRITERFFGVAFTPLAAAEGEEAHDDHLARQPDLDQVAIYLTEVLLARQLLERGLRPSILVGHSFGELAALTTAGVFGLRQGVTIVCQRVAALQSLGVDGKMAALSCGRDQVRDLLGGIGDHALEISVVNYPRQTIVSGPLPEIERLRDHAAGQGVTATVLKSRYPFHSSHLRGAVPFFDACLRAHPFRAPRLPVHLCTERTLLEPGTDLAAALSTQFVKPLDFQGIVEELAAQGHRSFVECGAGDIVTGIVGKILPEQTGSIVTPTALPAVGARRGIEMALERMGSAGVPASSSAAENPAGELDDLRRSIEQAADAAHEALARLDGLAPTASPPPQDPLLASNGQPRAVAASNGYPAESCDEIPIAIVGQGCVLPGATDSEQFWHNILEGVSGIVDLAEEDPHARGDFMAGSESRIVSDKTYTLLNGSILEVPYPDELLEGVFTASEFERLTRGQKLLAVALGQSLQQYGSSVAQDRTLRIECILGATADGSEEFDDALFADRMHARAAALADPQSAEAFSRALEQAAGIPRGTSDGMTQHDMYSQVVERFFGRRIKTYVVDTACSSSLYSIGFGIKALRAFESDLVLAGGVFAPGPANNTLFAQFRGLTPHGSRPFDAAADGVIFGDGSGIVALKRLPEAMEGGDPILAVIRGIGFSSDGKSPSINVPQPVGQSIAVRRAYAKSGVPLETTQYVEAHATSTPVGDAAEFNGLREIFSERDRSLPPVQLGSVKALIGHTGWASAVASVIKFCKAFEHGLVPRQYNYDSPNADIELEGSPFSIARDTHPWADNIDHLPRRAGINSFGFGGTNAHLIMEEFEKGYHSHLCRDLPSKPVPRGEIALVGVGALFPAVGETATDAPGAARLFERGALRLPAKKMLLPDVTEHMDPSQYLGALAAEKIFATFPADWTERLGQDVGVVLGLTSKTERGVHANERVFLDRLRRMVTTAGGHDPNVLRVLDQVCERVSAENIPSGPYTLPGLMPNVAASRVTSLYDLKGPNIVIDRGSDSMAQALIVAAHLLASGDCKIVLAGGLSTFGSVDQSSSEAAVLLGLTPLEVAQAEGLPVLGRLRIDRREGAAEPAAAVGQASYRGARGAESFSEIATQLEGGTSIILCAADDPAGDLPFVTEVALDPVPGRPSAAPATARPAKEPEPAAPAPAVAAPGGAYAFVEGTPIHTMTSRLVPELAGPSQYSLEGRKILFLTDQPESWQRLRESSALAAFSCQVLCPSSVLVPGASAIDLDSGDSSEASVATALAGAGYDIIIVVNDVAAREPDALLKNELPEERRLADLLFAVVKHAYDRISAGDVAVASLCLGAFRKEELDPHTGLLAGFMKSLARELPEASCCALNFESGHLLEALRCVELEFGQPATSPSEVCYRGGERHVFQLVPVQALATDRNSWIDQDSVVIATGGGRGVTAVLAEQLLQDYGCTVIALGRTDLSGVPNEILEMPEDEFKAFESDFYKQALARDKSQRIKDLKARYASYQASNELNQVINRLQALPGTFEYASVDINDAAAVEELVRSTVAKFGAVHAVVHGAGIQVSKVIPKKPLDLFQRIVGTKLASLRSLYQACRTHCAGRPVHFHLLTSAFSYLGNDGQPDYGAANEAMNRIAAVMNDREPDATWSSMAWLGWAGIGMTRGTEFAALAANRRLRGVTKEEGQDIFRSLVAGSPASPVNILMADGEIAFYHPAIDFNGTAPAPPAPAAVDLPLSEAAIPAASARRRVDHLVQDHEFTVENSPYLLDHRVHEVPTLPGAFIIGMSADIARAMRPDLHVAAFEDTNFLKFVSVFRDRGIKLRLDARVVSENEHESRIRVRVLSDFIHKSGVVLQKDVCHTEIFVRMTPEIPVPPRDTLDPNGFRGLQLPDPYVMSGSPVQLDGQFNSMRELVVGDEFRRASYQLNDRTYPQSNCSYLLPNVIMVDAFWRFGTVQIKDQHTLSVFVPRRCRVMKVFFDYTDFNLPSLSDAFTFMGTNPRSESDTLHVGPIEVRNARGDIMLIVEGGECIRFGDIENAY